MHLPQRINDENMNETNTKQIKNETKILEKIKIKMNHNCVKLKKKKKKQEQKCW